MRRRTLLGIGLVCSIGVGAVALHGCGLGYIEIVPESTISFRIENTQSLEDRRPIRSPLLVLWHWKPYGQKSPTCEHRMVAFLHMAGLTCGCSDCFRESLILF